MKNILPYLLSLLIIVISFQLTIAQKNNEEPLDVVLTENPYPISNQANSATMAAFISQFEDTSIGNLHVYATTEKMPSDDYFYQGKDITGTFNDMLPNKLNKLVRRTNGKIYAVKSIKGNAREMYILRAPSKKNNSELVLYKMAGTQLIPVMPLAKVSCKRSGACSQMDSWIQDINGDTRLDIIQKTQKTNRAGQVVKTKTKVYTQTQNGRYTLDKSADVKENSYLLEKMK